MTQLIIFDINMRYFIIVLLLVFSKISFSQGTLVYFVPKDTFEIYKEDSNILYIVTNKIKGEKVTTLYKKNKFSNEVEVIKYNQGIFPENSTSFYSGVLISFYNNNDIKEIKYLLDGKLEGMYYELYNKEKIKHVAFYKGGFFNGKELFIYKNGYVWLEQNYKDGLLNGKVKKFYYGKGKLLYESNFVNGVKNGMETDYFRSGKVSMEHPYINGKVTGTGKFYNKKGELIKIGYYENDKLLRLENIN